MNRWTSAGILAAGVLLGIGAAIQRAVGLRGHMPSHLLLWIAAWGASGYVFLCIGSLVTNRPPRWMVFVLAVVDFVVLAFQLATRDREGQFTTLNFLPFWYLLIAVFAAADVLSRSAVKSPGPSILGKPVWRAGLFLACAGLLAQITPRTLSGTLDHAVSVIALGLVLIGLTAFAIGGIMRMTRRETASNSTLQRTRSTRR